MGLTAIFIFSCVCIHVGATWTLDVSAGSAIVRPASAFDFLQTTQDVSVLVDHNHCDYASPRLRAMTMQLRKKRMLIRMSGTEIDYTQFVGFGRSVDHHQRKGPPTPPFSRVLTRETFDKFMDFVNATQMAAALGMNGAGYGVGVRSTATPRGPWLPQQAQEMMLYLLRRYPPNIVAAFEFSNEPNLMNMTRFGLSEDFKLKGSDFARDIRVFRDLIHSVYGSTAHHPQVFCCDVAYVPLLGQIGDFSNAFAEAAGVSNVDELTMHFYPLIRDGAIFPKWFPAKLDPFNATPTKVLDPWVLDMTHFYARLFARDSSMTFAALPPLVMGETGSAVGGGQPGNSG